MVVDVFCNRTAQQKRGDSQSDDRKKSPAKGNDGGRTVYQGTKNTGKSKQKSGEMGRNKALTCRNHEMGS